MSITFDPQFHTCIARHGARAVWLAAPLPPTLLPQKAELHCMWREEESRRLRRGAPDGALAPQHELIHGHPTRWV